MQSLTGVQLLFSFLFGECQNKFGRLYQSRRENVWQQGKVTLSKHLSEATATQTATTGAFSI